MTPAMDLDQQPLAAFQALLGWAGRDPGRAFLHQPVQGELRSHSFAECADSCRRMAAALLRLGLQPGDRVAILGKNCAEWFLADWALQMAGLVSVPIYPTAGRETIAYVISHSEARAVFVGPLDGWQDLEPGVNPDIPRIAMPYPTMACQHQWQDLLASQEPLPTLYEPAPESLMSILYTSGSTGQPKGVMMSYGAYQYSCVSTAQVMEYRPEDRQLSYLPLAHITERTVVEGPAVFAGTGVWFVESLETFQRDLQRARATGFISVPRLWLKFQSGVYAKIPPRRLGLLLSLPVIGRRMAARIRAGLGFSHCRSWGSGTAPISLDILRWYARLGVNISEGWGMTEVTGIGSTNFPFRSEALGTVGRPFPGSEIRLSEAGEILYRGPGLFSGYYRQPELTAQSFTADGWFRTGDRGEWDEAAQAWRITGRVKDQFKSSKGKYVVPVPIESMLSASPLIEQVCVMGSGLPQPVAVVVLGEAAAALTRADIEAHLETTINAVNAELESHERLDALVVASGEWSVENGMLTPTLKIRRDALEQRYSELIARSHQRQVVWEDE